MPFALVALLIAVLSLGFSIGSFYWMHWHRGKLQLNEPPWFAAYGSTEKQILSLPFVFFNTGAKTLVVEKLRLVQPEEYQAQAFRFTAMRDRWVTEIGNEPREWSRPFVVSGRQTVFKVFEFRRDSGSTTFTEGTMRFALEAKLMDRTQWQQLILFDVHISAFSMQMINTNYRSYLNSPNAGIHDSPVE
jgi:hypothetical protein